VPWKLTVRSGPRVTRSRFRDLDQALAAVRYSADALVEEAPGRVVNLRVRRFEPDEQVTARLELAGPERLSPSVRAGIDVRGDGSTVAYVGRVRRKIIEPRGGEDSCSALGREVRARLS
jgi:hypothetical protein